MEPSRHRRRRNRKQPCCFHNTFILCSAGWTARGIMQNIFQNTASSCWAAYLACRTALSWGRPKVGKLPQRGVVMLDRLVRRLEDQARHGWVLHQPAREGNWKGSQRAAVPVATSHRRAGILNRWRRRLTASRLMPSNNATSASGRTPRRLSSAGRQRCFRRRRSGMPFSRRRTITLRTLRLNFRANRRSGMVPSSASSAWVQGRRRD